MSTPLDIDAVVLINEALSGNRCSEEGRQRVSGCLLISLKYANGLRNGANSDTHRCKQLTEHGEERCIKLREVAGFSAVRTIFQIVGPRKILHCLLGK